MKISVLTLFPEMFSGPFDFSMVNRAKEKGILTIDYVNIRDFSEDSYKTVDDHPYGGGAGMIMRVDVLDRALASVKKESKAQTTRSILLDPRGPTYSQKKAHELKTVEHLIFICGHYEGVDERVRSLVDEVISIGDYIVTGGELPAMAIIDSVVRLIPGVLNDPNSTVHESFETILEYPQYTRPNEYNGMKVPEILLSGNHKEIVHWRESEAKKITKRLRPDLLTDH